MVMTGDMVMTGNKVMLVQGAAGRAVGARS